MRAPDLSSDGHLPLVSIITAARNGSLYLSALIESVLAQDYPRIEHIVIDDGSDDNGATIGILEQYSHVRWWTRANQGQYATQNEGLAAATGSIVSVICADDCYVTPSAISLAVNYLLEHPEYGCVFGRALNIGEDGDLLEAQTRIRGRLALRLLKYRCTIPHCALFVRTDVLLGAGAMFDPWYRLCGDWEWLLHLKQNSVAFGHINQPVALFRVHDTQTSQNRDELRFHEERQRIRRIYGDNALARRFVGLFLDLPNLVLMAAVSFRRGGPRALWADLKEWASRRFVGD
jgi:glycosyltransferase involved in cell wall biosynthesis